jgi:hypothetical protein
VGSFWFIGKLSYYIVTIVYRERGEGGIEKEEEDEEAAA